MARRNFLFRAAFNLPHAFTRDVQPLADLLQRALPIIAEAESQANDRALRPSSSCSAAASSSSSDW
jgi:hypothetical protein